MKEKNRTKYTILGMLSLSPATGYEIIKRIKSSTNYFWSESMGQIYPALTQCVEEGWSTCKEIKSKDERHKKIYSITSAGKKILKEWLKKQPKNTSQRNELLLKLFFGYNGNDPDNIHHVVHHQKQLENEIETYEKIYEQLQKEYQHSPHLKYWLISLTYGIKVGKAELSWCKETVKLLSHLS